VESSVFVLEVVAGCGVFRETARPEMLCSQEERGSWIAQMLDGVGAEDSIEFWRRVLGACR
jgi:hypothetical protein